MQLHFFFVVVSPVVCFVGLLLLLLLLLLLFCLFFFSRREFTAEQRYWFLMRTGLVRVTFVQVCVLFFLEMRNVSQNPVGNVGYGTTFVIRIATFFFYMLKQDFFKGEQETNDIIRRAGMCCAVLYRRSSRSDP